jgi:N,N-dimethylformamidase
MKLVGYTDRLSVAPGQDIVFMISSEPARYQAQIVRLIHGDINEIGQASRRTGSRARSRESMRGRDRSFVRDPTCESTSRGSCMSMMASQFTYAFGQRPLRGARRH